LNSLSITQGKNCDFLKLNKNLSFKNILNIIFITLTLCSFNDFFNRSRSEVKFYVNLFIFNLRTEKSAMESENEGFGSEIEDFFDDCDIETSSESENMCQQWSSKMQKSQA
jgi:hypothetical protein